jgi:hypothetical protein
MSYKDIIEAQKRQKEKRQLEPENVRVHPRPHDNEGEMAGSLLLFLVGASIMWLPRRDSRLQMSNNLISPASEGTRDHVNWSSFAYAQYATNADYLCNSVMLFETLHRLQSKADRLLMYPSNYLIDELDSTRESWLLRKARDEFDVKLVPVEVQRRDVGDCNDPTF